METKANAITFVLNEKLLHYKSFSFSHPYTVVFNGYMFRGG